MLACAVHGLRKARGWLAIVAGSGALLALAACGGGDSAQEAASRGASPEGVYAGTLTGAGSSAFQMVILENGELWALYGTQAASTFFVRGLIQGAGTWDQGTYTVADVRDFGVTPPLSGRLTGAFDAKAGTISGSTNAGKTTVSFSGGPIPGSLYRYDTAATLSSVVGGWTLTDIAGEAIGLTVGSDGRFTGVSVQGCTLSGTLSPRRSGRNVFDLSLTFGPAPCLLPGQAASGIALMTPLASGGSQLIAAAVDGTRSVGTAAFGTR
jgi:hypothetical protein